MQLEKEFNNRVINNKPYSEAFLDVVDNTQNGELYRTGDQRWQGILGEEFSEPQITQLTTIAPAVLPPNHPLTQDFIEGDQLSDSDPVEHGLIVGKLAEHSVTFTEPRYQKAFLTACYSHDFHEGIVGDQFEKTKDFKLNELSSIIDSTLTSIHGVYTNQDLDTFEPGQLENLLEDVASIFIVEPKLLKKYGITAVDIAQSFSEKFGIRTADAYSVIKKAYDNPIYKTMSELYEKVHSFSFILATLSMHENFLEFEGQMVPEQKTAVKSLIYDVVQNNQPSFSDKNLPPFLDSINTYNQERVKEMAKFGLDSDVLEYLTSRSYNVTNYENLNLFEND